MGILMEIGFGTRKRPGLKVKGKSIRESLIEYLNKEIEIAENNGLELKSNKIKNGGRTGSVKEIRMWGEVVDGKRRMTLKALNKKLYDNAEHAKQKIDYTFNGISKNDVINEMKIIKSKIESAKENTLSFWYVEKNSTTKSIECIEVKV